MGGGQAGAVCRRFRGAGALSREPSDGIKSKLEGWLKLKINREKTRVVNLKEEEASVDFLGFTFRYYDDLQERGWRYLNVSSSAKGLEEETARDDRSSAVSEGDPSTDEVTEPAVEGLTTLLRLRVSKRGLRGINSDPR